MHPTFKNTPLTDFDTPAAAEAFRAALTTVRGRLGQTYPLVIGGERIFTAETFESTNPGRTDQVIGHFADATNEHAEQALASCWEAFDAWSNTPAEDRAAVLLRAAARMRARRHEFSAALVLEAGKSWPEADADTAEAIDFLEFYAREAIRWAKPQPTTPYPGESNTVRYIPLGAGVAIPPWNFPVGITTGIATAPIAAGNTMVLKPAKRTPLCGWMLFEVLEQSGLPAGVCNFLTCSSGARVGAHLVVHPRTRFITFTGSRAVGCWIFAEAGKVQPGQIWLKRVVAEMGGKDAILVDDDADLDAAADAIVKAAFGYQGQKCSACSRALLHADVYDELVTRIVQRTRQLRLGDPADPATQVGPVIDPQAERSILEYIEIGKTEGRLLVGGGKFDGPGHYIAPTVIADVDGDARIAQEEIFGPVLALVKVDDYEDGVRVFNSTDYGLTGGFFGMRNIADAKRRLHCGNLYINRKCTGALVDVQPFGGFNMSGTDAKAGGREHLLQFLQAKTISERLTPGS